MRNFWMKTQIHNFKTCKELCENFNIGEGDLILTEEFIFEGFLKNLNLKSNFLFLSKFGIGEPTYEMMLNIFEEIKDIEYKRVLAIGGGSVIDVSKLLALKTPKSLLAVYEKTEMPVKGKELIAVPTTCGTGSEVTNISVLVFKEKQSKIGLVSDEIIADHAVILPELVVNLPFKFFVSSSVDALIHAIESYVSPKSNCYSELFSIKAIEMILSGYMDILEKGEEYRKEIIEDFIIASNYAGVAFYNTGVGAVHALSFPLGGQYHVPHGEANYQCFTEVFKTYNRLNGEGKIKNINAILAKILKVDHKENLDVYDELEVVLNKLLAKKHLREFGMKEEEILSFTETVLVSQQRLLVNTYVPLSKQDIIDIYAKLY